MSILIHILEKTMKFQKKSYQISTKSFLDECKITKRDFYKARDILINDKIILVEKTTYIWYCKSINKEVSNDTTLENKAVSNDTIEGCQMIPQSVSNDTTLENHSIYNKKKENFLKKEVVSDSSFLNEMNRFFEAYPKGTEHTQETNFNTAKRKINSNKTKFRTNISMILKALENYKLTKNFKHEPKSPATFLDTWQDYRDINKLKENNELIETTSKNSASGAESDVVAVSSYNQSIRDSFTDEQKNRFDSIMDKFTVIKSNIKIQLDSPDEDYEYVAKVFDEVEYEKFEQMGGVFSLGKTSIDGYAQSMCELIYDL